MTDVRLFHRERCSQCDEDGGLVPPLPPGAVVYCPDCGRLHRFVNVREVDGVPYVESVFLPPPASGWWGRLWRRR